MTRSQSLSVIRPYTPIRPGLAESRPALSTPPRTTAPALGPAPSFTPLTLAPFVSDLPPGTHFGAVTATQLTGPERRGRALASMMFGLTAANPVAAVVLVFVLGTVGSAGIPALQTRLMDVAADGESPAAALDSAVNIANSLGAWLGGVVITARAGYAATGRVGAGLAGCGPIVAAGSVAAQRFGTPAESSVR